MINIFGVNPLMQADRGLTAIAPAGITTAVAQTTASEIMFSHDLGRGCVKTPARFHTDLFRSLFRVLRPSRDEEIIEIFAPRGRSQNFAEF